jgi:hypothetical protein
LYILTLTFFNSRREDRRFCTVLYTYENYINIEELRLLGCYAVWLL